VKSYQGFANDNPAGARLVMVNTDEGQRLLYHRVRHSPTGFSWGYGGSGPADLARSILWDYLEAEPKPACYQDFKFHYVAGWLPSEGWELSGDAIRDWLDTWEAEHGPASMKGLCNWCGEPANEEMGALRMMPDGTWEHVYVDEGENGLSYTSCGGTRLHG
jgi:hypothetical protein